MILAIKNLKTHIEQAQAGHESFFAKMLEAPKTSKLVYKKLKHIQSEQPKKTQETGLKDFGYSPKQTKPQSVKMPPMLSYHAFS